MIGKFKFTDKEIKTVLDSIVITVDSRENQWQHIEDYFIKKKILFKKMKHDVADFSFMIPANKELCIPRDIYFNDNIVIERKKNIIEVVNNLCEDGGNRLEDEFIRSKGAKFYFMIENSTYLQAIQGNYEISPGKISKYKAETFIDRLKTFEARYGINVHWGGNQIASGNFIYYTFRRWLREKLKNGDEKLCQ